MMRAMSGTARSIIDQASAIPYRRTGGLLEFCLITSAKRARWGVPKGIIDPGDTAKQTALKEAEEEAGLQGQIVGEVLGRYEYHKWGSRLVVEVFLMEVTHTAEKWIEDHMRQRCWCTADEACHRIERTELLDIFEFALTQIPHPGS